MNLIQFSFLVADAHISRWNPKALVWLFQNRVIPYFFPSHLSIHVQPQDNGVICSLHNAINNAESSTRIIENHSTIALLNSMLELALIDFRNRENETKKKQGTNSTTQAWGIKTGLEPADQLSQGWEEALKSFGRMNSLKMNYGKGDLYAAFLQTERPAFTEEDLSLINNAVVSQARNEVSEDNSFKHLTLKKKSRLT